MLTGAKLTLKRLFYDDSGVAIAYTVMASLFIFMLCVSVFAMSENIRRKMELQNACDAAAYSGAVVQADMLSRIAVLNRALSWTYLQVNRMEMDWLIEDNWIPLVNRQHTSDSNTVRNTYLNIGRGCGAHGDVRGVNYYASCVPFSNPYQIRMRNFPENEGNVSPADVVTRTDITNANTNMRTIMAEITNIRININNWINAAVNATWGRSGVSTAYALFLNGRGTVFAGEPATYFNNENNEANLLAFINQTNAAMRSGVNVWWVESSPGVRIQRQYVTGGLFHSWGNYYQVWECDPYTGHKFVPVTFSGGGQLDLTAIGQRVIGTTLNNTFFGSAGSIIVAARQPVVNPFSIIFGDANVSSGLYSAFNGVGRDMWTASAARAGVKFQGDSTNGAYRVFWPGATIADGRYLSGVWNLCEDDWDAVMLPLNRAWSNTNPTGWIGGQNATGLLNAIRTQLSIGTGWTGGSLNNYSWH